VALYLCFRFHSFYRLVLEKYVSQVEGVPHLLQFCLHEVRDDLPPATKEIHPSFESLVIIGTLGLQASLMDVHHDTSLRSILEDDSISSASRAHIHYCSNKRARLWLVVKPSICLFRIAHSTFTSMLHFRLGLIQPFTFHLFICECGHGLDASGTHLTRCVFGGQQIATHDVIQDIMYALARKSGHVVWREQWYAFTPKASLQIDLYMI
jgi:hypothetical protein